MMEKIIKSILFWSVFCIPANYLNGMESGALPTILESDYKEQSGDRESGIELDVTEIAAKAAALEAEVKTHMETFVAGRGRAVIQDLDRACKRANWRFFSVGLLTGIVAGVLSYKLKLYVSYKRAKKKDDKSATEKKR